MAFDRYVYVFNNPVRYTDPSGHYLCSGCSGEPGDENCQPGPDGVWVPSPSLSCYENPDCIDVYRTYKEVANLLGRRPTMKELLRMTIGNEYWGPANNADFEVIPGGLPYSPREIGREGIARNYYEQCGSDGVCSFNEVLGFLGAYQPWFDRPGVIDGSPFERARELTSYLFADYGGTEDELYHDIELILNPGNVFSSWRAGAVGNRPWQWFTRSTPPPNDPHSFGVRDHQVAILVVDLGNGDYFYMYTFNQDRNR